MLPEGFAKHMASKLDGPPEDGEDDSSSHGEELVKEFFEKGPKDPAGAFEAFKALCSLADMDEGGEEDEPHKGIAIAVMPHGK